MSDTKSKVSAISSSVAGGGRSVSRAAVGSKALAPRTAPSEAGESRGASVEARQVAWSRTSQYAQALVQIRRRRKLRALAWFLCLVVLPTLATAAYCFLVATPRYLSEAEFTYQTYHGPNSLASGLVQSVTGTSQTNTIDLGTIIYEFIRSPSLAEKLDKSLHLRRHFEQDKIDWLSRLMPHASQEHFLQYFRSRVSVSQGLGGYINVRVEAFDPAFAQTLAKAVVDASDVMIDNLTLGVRNAEYQFAKADLVRQEERVRKARGALTQFQNLHGDQDPSRAATQLGTIVGTLEGDLATARAQLASTQGTLSASSPIITQMKLKISSLEKQLKDQQVRLATDKNGIAAPYSEILDEYSAIQLEQEFAKTAYLASQQRLALATANLAIKQNYMVDFAPPNLPQRMSYVMPIETISTVFLSSLLLFVFGSLVVGAAQDQLG